MKPFDYYDKPKTIYPNKGDYITYYVYDKGECLYKGSTFYTSKQEVKEDYPNAVIQEVLDEDTYKAHLKEYKDECSKLREEFAKDLFEDFGVSDNPKRYKALHYAQEKGNEYREIYDIFCDIVELIED
jgi:hypothetical protein